MSLGAPDRQKHFSECSVVDPAATQAPLQSHMLASQCTQVHPKPQDKVPQHPQMQQCHIHQLWGKSQQSSATASQFGSSLRGGVPDSIPSPARKVFPSHHLSPGDNEGCIPATSLLPRDEAWPSLLAHLLTKKCPPPDRALTSHLHRQTSLQAACSSGMNGNWPLPFLLAHGAKSSASWGARAPGRGRNEGAVTLSPGAPSVPLQKAGES